MEKRAGSTRPVETYMVPTMLLVCQRPPGWKQSDNCMGLCGLSKLGWQQATTVHHVGGTSASDKKFSDKNTFLKQCRWEKEFQLSPLSGFPCEIFSMEGNDILCFLSQEVVFVLGDSFLHASVESSGFCMLVTEQLAWKSPPLNRLLLREKRIILILSRQDDNRLLEWRYRCLP